MTTESSSVATGTSSTIDTCSTERGFDSNTTSNYSYLSKNRDNLCSKLVEDNRRRPSIGPVKKRPMRSTANVDLPFTVTNPTEVAIPSRTRLDGTDQGALTSN